MPKTKYMVTSGFLGAGKTTSMLALAREINARWGKAAILANDLGAGNIVDADYTATSEVLTTSVSGRDSHFLGHPRLRHRRARPRLPPTRGARGG